LRTLPSASSSLRLLTARRELVGIMVMPALLAALSL
jgi:hypothetical protein